MYNINKMDKNNLSLDLPFFWNDMKTSETLSGMLLKIKNVGPCSDTLSLHWAALYSKFSEIWIPPQKSKTISLLISIGLRYSPSDFTGFPVE